ncbi:hypothetical protein TRIUR3_12269 [Triticum urartu]|uniref:Uncharacterized protein n=1 Tax=Triticum urartu TaxID=4572 RepID=M8AKI5_TRIUA|nr:hypothetical protein TRIUR3_12269 [Triticum urartu]
MAAAAATDPITAISITHHGVPFFLPSVSSLSTVSCSGLKRSAAGVTTDMFVATQRLSVVVALKTGKLWDSTSAAAGAAMIVAEQSSTSTRARADIFAAYGDTCTSVVCDWVLGYSGRSMHVDVVRGFIQFIVVVAGHRAMSQGLFN